ASGPMSTRFSSAGRPKDEGSRAMGQSNDTPTNGGRLGSGTTKRPIEKSGAGVSRSAPPPASPPPPPPPPTGTRAPTTPTTPTNAEMPKGGGQRQTLRADSTTAPSTPTGTGAGARSRTAATPQRSGAVRATPDAQHS